MTSNGEMPLSHTIMLTRTSAFRPSAVRTSASCRADADAELLTNWEENSTAIQTRQTGLFPVGDPDAESVERPLIKYLRRSLLMILTSTLMVLLLMSIPLQSDESRWIMDPNGFLYFYVLYSVVGYPLMLSIFDLSLPGVHWSIKWIAIPVLANSAGAFYSHRHCSPSGHCAFPCSLMCVFTIFPSPL